ncbi:MAG: hypothetical protein ABIR78_12440 [Ferruginibacter sp.]
MHFEKDQVYHVYNRGNNKQTIFFTDANYLFFLQKIKAEWKQYCEILCYCLMPNHFHFMLVPNESGCDKIVLGDKSTYLQNLSKAIGKTLSSYTKAINLQNGTTGNLFQKKTKAKCLTEDNRIISSFTNHDHLLTCFHYIHQNPKEAKLVTHLKDWQYSSYPDYYDFRNGTVCNKILALQVLDLSEPDLKAEQIIALNVKIIEGLF